MVQCYSECISIKIYVFIRRNQTSFLWILDADWLSRARLTWFSQNRYFHLFISAPRHDNTYVKLHRNWLIQKKYNEYHPFTQHFFFIFFYFCFMQLYFFIIFSRWLFTHIQIIWSGFLDFSWKWWNWTRFLKTSEPLMWLEVLSRPASIRFFYEEHVTEYAVLVIINQ